MKIRGKFLYFGKDYDEAIKRLACYLQPERSNDRDAGLDLTVKLVVNGWLTAMDKRRECKKLSHSSFRAYKATGKIVADKLGRSTTLGMLTPGHFMRLRNAIGERYGTHGIKREITQVKMLFKWCHETELIRDPIRFGPEFKPPSALQFRREKNDRGERLFNAEQIQTLLANAFGNLRAMILLGINCGFGNADCGTLRWEHIKTVDGQTWHCHPRPKTGIERRCVLWPETVAALPEARESGFVFRTKFGNPYHKDVTSANPISSEFKKLADKLGIKESFYTLRRTFETIAGESKDQVAVDFIMGHVDPSMAAVYRQRIENDRLVDACQHVREWLMKPSANSGSELTASFVLLK